MSIPCPKLLYANDDLLMHRRRHAPLLTAPPTYKQAMPNSMQHNSDVPFNRRYNLHGPIAGIVRKKVLNVVNFGHASLIPVLVSLLSTLVSCLPTLISHLLMLLSNVTLDTHLSHHS